MARKPALPKTGRVVIAEHEAGMHDSPKGRFPGRGPDARCPECKREAADLDRRYA